MSCHACHHHRPRLGYTSGDSLSLSLGIALGIEGGPGGWSLNHALDLVQYPFHHSLSIAKALAGHLFNLSLHPIEMAMSKYLVRL
jgi:hypothetical protein